MKKTLVYGIEMTSLEQMTSSKFLSANGIAMNTKTAEERERLALEWLEDHLSKQGSDCLTSIK